VRACAAAGAIIKSEAIIQRAHAGAVRLIVLNMSVYPILPA